MARPAFRFGPWRLALAGAAFALLAAAPSPPPETVHRKQLQEQPFPPPRYRTVTVRVVVDPGGEVTPHSHPGVEMAYVIEGQAALRITGKSEYALSTGDSFSVPRDTVHSVRNTGAGALTLVSTYVVDKGKPIAIPAR